jgi:ATP-dependent helicase HrpA
MDPTETTEFLNTVQQSSGSLLLRDRAQVQSLLHRIEQRIRQRQPADRLIASLQTDFIQALERAQKWSSANLTCTYPEDLPVSGKRDEIRKLIEENPVVIVCGTTGSGKTTQLPKIVLESGAGKTGRIGVTQPRRLAATGMARRVAEEMNTEYGKGVGCQVRFDDQTCDETLIKFMTDGILLAETRSDRNLLQYDCLIIDEAHERSLNIDLILGYIKNLLKTRTDLKVIISSATLDAKSFSTFFNDAPVIEVEGRTYPVDDFFLPPGQDEDLSDHIARAMRWINEIDTRGDVLVFLPGEREIRDAIQKLEGQKWADTEVLPLFGRLSMSEQQRVFKVGGRRRIILATNVAETSITIPGIHYVIDSGLVRLSRYNPRIQVQGLQIEQISQASARQRRGRCGRVASGICIYLYDEETLAHSDPFTDPEIRRTSLAGVILQMDLLGLPPIDRFPLLDPPSPALVHEGYKALFDIGAIDEHRKLTPLGRDVANFPVDPHLARMLVQANQEGALQDVLILVAFLSMQDVRERPAEKAEAADLAHKQWVDPKSDFITILNLWNFIESERDAGASHGKLRRLCSTHFVNYRRVQEWRNLRQELEKIIREKKWKLERRTSPREKVHSDLIHRSLLAGLPANIGVKGDGAEFTGARDRRFFIFPGSALFKKPPQWVMTFALVDTARLYARTVAEIDPAWVNDVAPHLCKSVYRRPVWNGTNGFVYAKESIVSGGLQLINERRVHYGPIHPEEARKIFIRDGLVPGDLITRDSWLKQHQEMLNEIHSMEEKVRRPGALLDPEAIYDHFDRLIPPDVYSVPTLEKWIRKTNTRIAMKLEDALYEQSVSVSSEEFPRNITFHDEPFQLLYTHEPGDELDGVAVVCPSDKLASLPEWATDWLVPGRLEEKVAALLRTLPKNLRTRIVPINLTAKNFTAAALSNPPKKPLLEALVDSLQRTHRLPVDAADFNPDALPDDLQMKVIETHNDQIVQIHSKVTRQHRQEAKRTEAENVFADWIHPPQKKWPCGELPERVVGDTALKPVGHLALSAEPGGVGTRVFVSETEAWHAHRAGLTALFRIEQPEPVQYVEKRPPIHPLTQLSLAAIDRDVLTDFVDAAIFCALTEDNTLEIRNANAFAERAGAARGMLYETAAERAQILTGMMEQREKISAALDELPSGDARDDIEMQLAFLFRPGFLQTAEIFDRLPRYLKSVTLRIERLKHNPEADAKKMAEVEPFQNRLNDKLLACGNIATAHDLIECAMLLEEFRVNRFAPEIRTPVKASAKRLDQLFATLP